MNQTFYGCASITSSLRTDIIRKDVIPGPGTYRPRKQDSESIPLWTLKPKIQYTSCFHSNNLYVPSPGAYDLTSSTSMANKSTQAGSRPIKYKERSGVEKSSPVIELQIPSFVDRRAGFSFGYRDQIVIKETSPGPIYHIHEIQQESRRKKVLNSSGFGFGQRSKFQKEETPGPGSYSPSEKMYSTQSNWTFSKSSRKNKPVMTNSTGPGEYNPQLYSTCRSFKLKGRYQERRTDCLETSPQSYNLPDTKSKRGAIIRKLPSHKPDGKQYDGPSPFLYQTHSSLKTGGYSLGKKLQVIDQNLQNPGPGSYQSDEQLFAKNGGYICRRQKEKKKMCETSDIFCKYNPKTDIVQYKYPQFTFKQSQNKSIPSNSRLGPGSYNANKYSCSESYSIGKDIRFKPLKKEKSFGNMLNQVISSSFGNLPSYLRQKKTIKQDQAVAEKENMPTEEN